jgi:hypothetical protein
MKTIAAPAMAAIEAGEAIVGGAVEIIPLTIVTPGTESIAWSTVTTVNLSALTNAATTAAGGLTAGILVSGFDPSDKVRVSLPSGGTYAAWSEWGDPSPISYTPPKSGAIARFDVIPDGDAARTFAVGSNQVYDGYEAARAAFVRQTFTGASSYRFYIKDNPTTDNSGGLSILVEKGVVTSTGGGSSSGTPLRLWGGYGTLNIDGEDFLPLGNSAVAQKTAGALGGVAQGLTLGLSGIDPYALSLLDDADQYQGASVVTYRLIFAPDGKTLLDAHVFDRGRIDTIDSDETIGATAAIMAAIESAARGLGRSGSRQRSDSDQRLIAENDGYFKNVAYAGQKMLYWGGKRPAIAGAAVGRSTGGFWGDGRMVSQ